MLVTLEKKITVSRTRKSGSNYLLNAHQWPIISINLTLQRNRRHWYFRDIDENTLSDLDSQIFPNTLSYQ